MTNYNIFSKDFWENNSAKDGAIVVLSVFGFILLLILIIVVWRKRVTKANADDFMRYCNNNDPNDQSKNSMCPKGTFRHQ